MTTRIPTLPLLSLTTLLAGCQSICCQKDGVPSGTAAAIAESNRHYSEAMSRNDPSGIVACYARDACLYPPESPALCGPEAIRGFAEGALASGIRGIQLNTTSLAGSNVSVTEWGTYTLTLGNGQVADEGTYVVQWKPENGQWRMWRDLFNSRKARASR
ncbi:MAG: DUF4440 domain-containing protein [Verrucomicrobiota bacterium]